MLALSIVGAGRVDLVDRRPPVVENDSDAIVRITTAAIGPRDVMRYTGPDPVPGTVPGAEFCGVVDEIGADVSTVDLGDLVTALAVFECPGGRRRVFGWGGLDGAHALYARVPDADLTLVRVPSAAIEERALLLSDTYGAAAAAADCALERGAKHIAVFGCDPYGTSVLVALNKAGSTGVTAMDEDERRLGTARRLGAQTLDSSKPGAMEDILQESGGAGLDAVIVSASLRAADLGTAMSMVRDDGWLILVDGDLPGRWPVLPGPARGIEIVVPRPPDRSAVATAMLDLWGGTLDLAALVSHVMPLADASQGYRMLHAREPGVSGVLLKV